MIQLEHVMRYWKREKLLRELIERDLGRHLEAVKKSEAMAKYWKNRAMAAELALLNLKYDLKPYDVQ